MAKYTESLKKFLSIPPNPLSLKSSLLTNDKLFVFNFSSTNHLVEVFAVDMFQYPLGVLLNSQGLYSSG